MSREPAERWWGPQGGYRDSREFQEPRGSGQTGSLPKVAGIPTVGPTGRLHLRFQQTDSCPAETLLPRGSGLCSASSQQQGCLLVLEPHFPCLWNGATIK